MAQKGKLACTKPQSPAYSYDIYSDSGQSMFSISSKYKRWVSGEASSQPLSCVIFKKIFEGMKDNIMILVPENGVKLNFIQNKNESLATTMVF